MQRCDETRRLVALRRVDAELFCGGERLVEFHVEQLRMFARVNDRSYAQRYSLAPRL